MYWQHYGFASSGTTQQSQHYKTVSVVFYFFQAFSMKKIFVFKRLSRMSTKLKSKSTAKLHQSLAIHANKDKIVFFVA